IREYERIAAVIEAIQPHLTPPIKVIEDAWITDPMRVRAERGDPAELTAVEQQLADFPEEHPVRAMVRQLRSWRDRAATAQGTGDIVLAPPTEIDLPMPRDPGNRAVYVALLQTLTKWILDEVRPYLPQARDAAIAWWRRRGG